MGAVRRFGIFWWDFVVGEDWVLAVGVAAGIGLEVWVGGSSAPWAVLPVAVAITLAVSLWRARAAHSRKTGPGDPGAA